MQAWSDLSGGLGRSWPLGFWAPEPTREQEVEKKNYGKHDGTEGKSVVPVAAEMLLEWPETLMSHVDVEFGWREVVTDWNQGNEHEERQNRG